MTIERKVRSSSTNASPSTNANTIGALVFAFVLSAAFLLLLVTFRSIVIPIKAIVLNLLSVGAAYGVLVWGFQDGHLEKVLGFESTGAIVHGFTPSWYHPARIATIERACVA